MALFTKKLPDKEILGTGLKAGDEHYRAYVGPPQDYDLISAMVFNLLTCIGLRQHHRVLDIGCGSLRIGRLLIPYLNKGHYFGVEPNKWLVKEGINYETGKDLIKIKQPNFIYDINLQKIKTSLNIDFAIAQSIFSHCGTDLISQWLMNCNSHLSDNGALLATYVLDSEDFDGDGWVYPQCVKYKTETIETIAKENNFNFYVLDWKHPRQIWALFSKPDFDTELISEQTISWNHYLSNYMDKLNNKS